LEKRERKGAKNQNSGSRPELFLCGKKRALSRGGGIRDARKIKHGSTFLTTWDLPTSRSGRNEGDYTAGLTARTDKKRVAVEKKG